MREGKERAVCVCSLRDNMLLIKTVKKNIIIIFKTLVCVSVITEIIIVKIN